MKRRWSTKEVGAVAGNPNPLTKQFKMTIIQRLEAHTSDSPLLNTNILLLLSQSLQTNLLLTCTAATAAVSKSLSINNHLKNKTKELLVICCEVQNIQQANNSAASYSSVALSVNAPFFKSK